MSTTPTNRSPHSNSTTPTHSVPTSPTISRTPSTSLRRKPVPGLLDIPLPGPNMSQLPASHPFASSPISPTGRPSSGKSSPSFFKSNPIEEPQRPRSIPPPPRRAVSGLGIVLPPSTVSSNNTTTTAAHVERNKTPTPPLTETGASQNTDSPVSPSTPVTEIDTQSIAPSVDLFDILNATPINQDGFPGTTGSTHTKSIAPSVDMYDILNATPIVPESSSTPKRPDSTLSHSRTVSLNHPLPPLPLRNSNSTPNTLTPTQSRPQFFTHRSSSNSISKKEKEKEKNKIEEPFSIDGIPSKESLLEAGTCFVKDENGELVCFGDFFPKRDIGVEEGKEGEPPIRKTVVFFIRHFWCGQCQDFTFASLAKLDPVSIAKSGINVVIISNGSWKIIKKYKEIFECPFPIYVDGPRKLYSLMGMTKLTNDFGPLFKGRAEYHRRPVPTQFLAGVGNALFKLPLADPGKLTQLGGEFILSPGFECDFAHRMTNTSNHMEAPEVVRLAGCPTPTAHDILEFELEENKRIELARLEEEMKQWRESREQELERMRRKKAARRGLEYTPPSRPLTGFGLETESGHSESPEINLDLDDADIGVIDNEMDERFAKVLAMDQGREDEGVMDVPAKGVSNGLEVSVNER